MVNNIIWKGPWEINNVERKNSRENTLWLRLIGTGDDECKIRLPGDMQILSVKGFYDLKWSSIIDTIRVEPNRQLRIIICEDSNYTNKSEINIMKVGNDSYRILVSNQRDDDIGFAVPYVDDTLGMEQLKEKMMAFESYLELFSFLLPLGKCFEVDKEE